jgi:hypothetical protein
MPGEDSDGGTVSESREQKNSLRRDVHHDFRHLRARSEVDDMGDADAMQSRSAIVPLTTSGRPG